MASFRVRPAGQSDGAFLGDMVVEAANWRPEAARPKVQLLSDPEHTRYLTGWKRPPTPASSRWMPAASPSGRPGIA